jgi:hypothetical protein
MPEKEYYTAFFDECILKKPKRLSNPNSIVERAALTTPPEVLERQNSGEKFEPAGFIPGTGRYYEAYKPDGDPLLRPDVVVARDPSHPLQRIVGPKKEFIEPIMLSFFYLKNFFGENNPFRHMDLIASNSYSVDTPYDVKRDGYLWTHALLEKLGIEKMRAKYSNYGPWNQEKPHVGIRRDIPRPVFFMQFSQPKTKTEENEIAIKQASNMVHDFTHFLLSLYEYRATGPTAERICLLNQASFLQAIYCSNLFDMNTTPFDNWTLGRDTNMSGYISRLIDYIEDYRTGGNSALSEASKAFGYKIPKLSDGDKYPVFKDFR